MSLIFQQPMGAEKPEHANFGFDLLLGSIQGGSSVLRVVEMRILSPFRERSNEHIDMFWNWVEISPTYMLQIAFI